MSKLYDVIVIGTGIAGLSAAKQCAQDGLSTAMMEALLFGGLVTNVNALDGEISGSGVDLAATMMQAARKLGAENIAATVTGVAKDGDAYGVTSDAGAHRARAVIIASGARLRRLGVPGEVELQDMGVSNCADCDGPFYQGQDVVVVGGGDSALQEALVLMEFAKTVHLVHRGEHFSAQQHLADKVAACANITVHWHTTVAAVLGDGAVSGVRVRDAAGVEKEIPCTGFFAYIGLEPACEFAPAEIGRDAGGRLLTDAALQTAVPGVFAAGAVRSGCGGLLTHAVADGIAAAKSAVARLRG